MRNDPLLNQKTPNVLIIDDIPDNLQILGDILGGDGYRVREVTTGMRALQVAEKEKPDLILLDIMIPDMDGFEVCRRLKENQNLKSVPIIFISALNDTLDIVKALTAGGVDYITKPFKAEEVKARVATHLKIHQQSEELRELNENLEQRVAERTKQLEFHLKEIEQFTYITSHDLSEPLNTLANFTRLIHEEYAGKLDEDGNKSIDFIFQSATRMKLLLKGLLDYSLLGKDSIKSDVDCNKAVAEVLSDLSDAINASHARITVHELPRLTGYGTELKLLFQNLINNAIKFRKKDICPEIIISAEFCEKEWKFTIDDNGIGVREQSKEKVFIIFRRMVKRNEFEGIGIGLAHCKKIVELHGGNIWMEPNKMNGSTFVFTIPI